MAAETPPGTGDEQTPAEQSEAGGQDASAQPPAAPDPAAPAVPPQQPPGPPAPPPGGAPVLSSVVPGRGPVAGGTKLTLLGSGLKPPQSITVGGATVTGWTVVSEGELQITLPPGDAGPVDVVVTVGGKASTGPAKRFEYVPVPVIHAAEVIRKEIHIHGANLTPALGVTVGGAAPATTLKERGGVVTVVPAAGPTGDVPITVQTEGGTSNAYVVSIPAGWTRTFCFWLALVYFGVLIALLLTYKTIPSFHGNFPALPGGLPPAIPWFGALGAVALSLAGVTYHSAKRDWDRGYLLWHAVRPVMGAIFGSIAYFIIAGGVLASGGQPNGTTSTASVPTPAVSASASPAAAAAPAVSAGTGQSAAAPAESASPATKVPTQNLFYIVLAFVVGWREETFRSLLQRVADVLFTPGSGGGGSGTGGAGKGGSASGSSGSPPGGRAAGGGASGTAAQGSGAASA